MKNVIFDMETGDPDDLITLLLLLLNPQVSLKAVSCYQGSPLQIGLIQHIINLSGKNIPLGGWNSEEPKTISPYYQKVVGNWKLQEAQYTPVEIFQKFLTADVSLLTGAPLTNLKLLLAKEPNFTIQELVVQGGYLGSIVPEEQRLSKFKNIKSIQTYNLSNDVEAFTSVFNAPNFHKITFVTKDLCHGFKYDKNIQTTIQFQNDDISQILFNALDHYASSSKAKALHDPLAMIYLLNPEIGTTSGIFMDYQTINDKNLFYSVEDHNNKRMGLSSYSPEKSWDEIRNIIEHKSPSIKKRP